MPYFPYSKKSRMKKHRVAIVAKSIETLQNVTYTSDCQSFDNGWSKSCHNNGSSCLPNARILYNPSRQSLRRTILGKMDSRTHHKLARLCHRLKKPRRHKTCYLPRRLSRRRFCSYSYGSTTEWMESEYYCR